MKKKFVVALVAAMSLTVAGTGTVFAMDKVSTIASEKEHVHGDNCEWIVRESRAPEEGHFETVHHPAEYETVHHPAEYDTVHHPAEYDTIHHPKKVIWRLKCSYCNGCGQNFGVCYNFRSRLFGNHMKENFMNGDSLTWGHGSEQREVWVVDKEAWDEQVLIKDAWDEQVLVKDAWDEQVLVKEAWDEIVHHPEEGHWVCNGEPQEPEQKPENPDQKPEQPENPEQKPEQPENPDQKPEQPENPDQKPEQPENPDQKPEQPENPDVETPETPDAENPATPEQKPDANKENVQTQETETKKEGTSPKTGDTTSALPVAGAGLASLGVVLATILKKRK